MYLKQIVEKHCASLKKKALCEDFLGPLGCEPDYDSQITPFCSLFEPRDSYKKVLIKNYWALLLSATTLVGGIIFNKKRLYKKVVVFAYDDKFLHIMIKEQLF